MHVSDCLPAWGGFLFGAGTGYRGPMPMIGPELAVFYCPSRHRHRPSYRPSDFNGSGPQWARLWAPGLAAQPLGLAEETNSDTPRKQAAEYGSRGLLPKAKRQIRAAAALLERHRSSCGLWTVTVPDSTLEQLGAPMAWARFQNALRHRLVRLLRRRMGQALVVGVVEIHPQRSAAAGQQIPHLHILFRGKRPGERRWRIRRHEFDRMIRQAFAAAGISEVDVRLCGNLKRIRKSVAAYLSKYLTKAGEGSSAPPPGKRRIRVCQWWLMSREVGRMIQDATVPVDPAFIAWAADRIRKADGTLRGFVSRVSIPDPKAPPWWRVSFAGVRALGEALALWMGHTGKDSSALTETFTDDRPKPQQHPLRHQHLRATGLLGGAGPSGHRQRRLGERHRKPRLRTPVPSPAFKDR